MKNILNDKSFKLSIILTLIFFGIGIAFLLLGIVEYSLVLFAFLPIVLGVSLGALPNKKLMMIGAVIATVVFLASLVAYGASGLICVVMSLPLIAIPLFTGSVIMHLIRRYKDIQSDKLHVLLLPLIPFLIIAPSEKFLLHDAEKLITVQSEIVFHHSPEEVYDAIKSVDTIDGAKKPWLMTFDLPVPTKCVLEKEEVGGLRVCHFEKGNFSNSEFGGGTITEKITELERGRILKMDVTDYNLIGRKWLGFKDAIYYFEKVGDNDCKMIRITTYSSVLKPRWYWQPMEELGIQQEHEYIFNYLQKKLD